MTALGSGSSAPKTALVTGGGSGIGRAAAIALAGNGMDVAVVDRNIESATAVVDEIAASGGRGLAIQADVALDSDCQRMVAETVEVFGSLGAAFNNAGIAGATKTLAEVSLEEFTRVISVNLYGVFLSMKYELKHMIGAGGGAIVNTASRVASIGLPAQGDYACTKAGIASLSRTAAMEYGGSNIRVNAVAPGSIRTAMMSGYLDEYPEHEVEFAKLSPLNRMGEALEVGQAVAWLLSDQASFVSGAVIAVDGGWGAA